MYALVNNGTLLYGPGELPENWKNISNLKALVEEELKKLGWLPVIDMYQEIETGQTHGEPILNIFSDHIERVFPAVASVKSRIISKFHLRNRITLEEKISIYNEAKTDVIIQILLDDLSSVQDYVNLDDVNIITGFDYLVSKNIISPARKMEILS